MARATGSVGSTSDRPRVADIPAEMTTHARSMEQQPTVAVNGLIDTFALPRPAVR
jgi:hypothetical protein